MDWLSVKSFLINSYPLFGLAGSLLMILTMFITGFLYRGNKGEKFSVFNHFISELGEVGVSKAATVFNGGLILGGAILIPFVVGFGLAINNIWATLGILAGVWAALSCMGVGIFPMNQMKPHVFVAMSYFRSGLVMVLLFGTAILLQKPGAEVITKASILAVLISLGCYAAFLMISDFKKPENKNEGEGDTPVSVLDPESEKDRPKYWKTVILEWAVFFSTILWFFIVAVYAIA